jgi:UDP-2,4-diacetamido-2,4,6-trideoxy-beta-L-altropyranose hydrolase
VRVAIRTTSGRAIGFGHLRRCLTLAEELRARGHQPALWLTGDPSGLELAAPIPAQLTDGEVDLSGVDWLVVDDYAVGEEALARLHGRVRLAVVDDLADRRLDADVILNGNANAGELRYRVPPACRLLLGPRYTLLRAAFRGHARAPAGDLRRVLVMMGGSDARGLTARAARACLEALPQVAVDAVIGPLAEAGPMPAGVNVLRAPSDLPSLMAAADLAVSAGGQTNYELAAMGLPALSLCVADNQRGNLDALSRVPTLRALFDDDDRALREALAELARDRDLRQKMSDAGRSLVDGLGAARVAEALENG